LIKRFVAGLAAFMAVFALSAGSAQGMSSYMQNQPLGSGKCGQYAASNAINWMTGANTTGEELFRSKKKYHNRKLTWFHTASGASYHSPGHDFMIAVAGIYKLNVQKFVGRKLPHGFRAARQALRDGGAIVMLVEKGGVLTEGGHFIMGYLYKVNGDKVAVSDSNRFNPDKWYSISWLLNSAKGDVSKLWVFT
jgi:hypothetical protein